MRYTDSGPRSAEILRLVLPSIARHGGSYIPTAYAVWYEHLSGASSRLTADMQNRLRQSDVLDTAVIEELYAEHILSRDLQSARQLQKGLEALAVRLAQAAADSSGGAETYARALEAGEAELRELGASEQLQAVLHRLLGSTHDARESVATLRAELDASRAELQQMRDHLGTLQSEAVTDPLTGLFNRRGFELAMRQQCGDGAVPDAPGALMMLDLDHFKRINDTYGHLLGDQVLCATAKVLRSVIRERDVAARFGGEEFLVLLPGVGLEEARDLAEQLRLAFSRARVRRAGSDKVIDQLSLSAGVAMLRSGESLERTLERADQALYRAKGEGRNCVRVAEAA